MRRIAKSKIAFHVLVCAVLVSFVLALEGCSTLRKKFVRQKKKEDKQEFVPVLDPVDYPDVVKTAGGIYEHHYMLSVYFFFCLSHRWQLS